MDEVINLEKSPITKEDIAILKKKTRTKNIIQSGQGVAVQIDPLTLAKDFIENQPIFYDKNKLWWVWSKDECKWAIHDETDVMNFVHGRTDILGMTNSGFKSSLLTALQMVARKKAPAPISKAWVQLGTRIYDLENNKDFEATPQYFVTNPLPYTPSNTTDTPFIDKLFREWVEPDNVDLLYELIAYCMLPDYPLHRIFAMVGSGSNGKGCFFRIIKEFIGLDNIASTELEALTSNRFESSRLYKKLVCMMTETNSNTLKQTSMLKKLSGGEDPIGFEFKNKNGFTDVNYAKILLSTNTLPQSNDNTDGFHRRWLVIKFPNQFDETSDPVNLIGVEEYKALASKCIGILKGLLQDRTFTNEGTVQMRRERYESESDPFGKFFKQMVVVDRSEQHIPVFEFENVLNDWLKKNGYNTMTKHDIKKRLGLEGVEKAKIQKFDDGSRTQWWYWCDVRWNNGDYSKNSKNSKNLNSFPYTRELNRIVGDSGDVGVKSHSYIKEMPFDSFTHEEFVILTPFTDEEATRELEKLTSNGVIMEPKNGIYHKIGVTTK